MKNRFEISRFSLSLLLIAGVSLFISGCAPPPASGNLQRKIDELLRVQQQQAEELEVLKQQLFSLGEQPLTLAKGEAQQQETNNLPSSAEPATEPEMSLPTAAAEEIAEMSESASLYLSSFAAIATGRMKDAAAGFREFVDRYPTHEYVGNAKYWLAEALFALQQPRYAETLLLEIIDDQEHQNKAPAAMARLVRYYRESGADQNAQAMLQMLQDRYPESSELNRLMQGNAPQ